MGKNEADHKCLKSITEYKARVKKELEETNEHIRSVSAQIDAAVKVIRDLTKSPVVAAAAPPSTPTRSKVTNNKELLGEIRKHLDNSGRVDGHATAKPLVEKVVEIVKDALLTKGDKVYDVTKAIKETLEAQYPGDWNVYILWNNIGYSFHNVHQEGFVEIKFNKASVAVYKSVESVSLFCSKTASDISQHLSYFMF